MVHPTVITHQQNLMELISYFIQYFISFHFSHVAMENVQMNVVIFSIDTKKTIDFLIPSMRWFLCGV